MLIKRYIHKLGKNYRKRAVILRDEGLRGLYGNSKGYVIIIVLLMTTLLISVTGEFIVTSQVTISYMRKYNSNLKSSYLSKSGVHLASHLLIADKKGMGAQEITGKATDKNILIHS